MAVAWRRPGHPFGPIAAVPGGQLSEPTLAFDSSGRAFLAGTALCENESHSHGVVLTAPAWSHRFGKPRTVTPQPATEVRFALTGAAHGVAAWLDAGCSTTELLGGRVSVRTVGTTSTGPVAAVAPNANDLQIVGPHREASISPSPGTRATRWVHCSSLTWAPTARHRHRRRRPMAGCRSAPTPPATRRCKPPSPRTSVHRRLSRPARWTPPRSIPRRSRARATGRPQARRPDAR